MFNPKYILNDSIVSSLTAIAEAKVVIERAKILPQQELKLRRQALARMTHSSTAIEGNELSFYQVEALVDHKKIEAAERDIHEVENYLSAMRYIGKIGAEKQPITEKVILHVHKLVTSQTLKKDESGLYRKVPVYVVRRRLGQPVKLMYTGPDASRVRSLVADLIAWIGEGESREIHPVVVAGVVHQEIAAIHPFTDGNGRTARALATLVLYQRGYDFRRLFALEDYYNEDRPAYYAAINTGENYQERKVDLTGWLEYFVRGFEQEIMKVKGQGRSLSAKGMGKDVQQKVFLDKDQLKIIDFIDHLGRITTKDVMDVLNCPQRTAQLCLQQLKERGIIVPVGKGRATYYILK
ncbi:MAG: Fic family protein [Candidatus Andersenbacteria bacterium]|nr:Fic family protein [Candidatus Andersenbacteria bacterium]